MARRVSMVVLILGAIGLLIWAGVYNYRAREARMEQARSAHVVLGKDTVAMDDNSALPDSFGKNLRHKPAPGFSLKTVDGKTLSSASFKGHPMVVNFWATYCGPCKLEMPWFEEFSHTYAAQGLQVIGVDDEDGVSPADVSKAAKQIGVTYPILLADTKAESAWGIGDYLPVTYYIDANGIVQVETAGAPSKDEAEANVRKILGAAK